MLFKNEINKKGHPYNAGGLTLSIKNQSSTEIITEELCGRIFFLVGIYSEYRIKRTEIDQTGYCQHQSSD